MAATATASAGRRYAPEDPTLPKPWKGLVDGKTGYLYFWNPETNVTQYQRPVATPDEGSLPTESSPTHASTLPTESSSTHVSSLPTESSSTHVSSLPTESSSTHVSSLPTESSSTHVSSLPTESSSTHVSSFVEAQQTSAVQESDINHDEEKHSRGNGASGQQSTEGGATHSQNVLDGSAGGPADGPKMSGTEAGLTPEAYRKKHEITVTGGSVPPPFSTFEATGFPSELLREVHQAGFSNPTPIQAQSWPIALQGRDIVAVAKTGSGKTLGYLIPGFLHLRKLRNNPQLGPTVLVVSPTRELATQIQDEAVKFGKSSRVSCVCLYGGAPKGPQLKELDRGVVDIVVATPGRLNDILEMRRISLHQVSYLVLDEADRMLDMGFEPQIRKIVNELPSRRQTLMYTATWPKEVRKIAADLLKNPVQVNIGNVDELVANKSITQYVEVISSMEKQRRLEQILRSQEPGSKIIIFCATKKMCDNLTRNIGRHFGASAIHGDKSQVERDNVLSQFRTGRSPVLVATDVAARGLDVKDIRVVVNYDFPSGIEDYVHRIGRTGRAGATGVAYTFFGDQDSKYASDLVKILEGASQKVPEEVRDMARRGGGGIIRRRWGSGPSGYDGGRGGRSDSGNGGRSDSSYGGRSDSGRGGWSSSGRGSGFESRDRDERSRSRSPDRGAPRSFHEMMMEKSRASQPTGDRAPSGWGGSSSARDGNEEGGGGWGGHP